eukprot:4336902-Prymnesium_polylepis.1
MSSCRYELGSSSERPGYWAKVFQVRDMLLDDHPRRHCGAVLFLDSDAVLNGKPERVLRLLDNHSMAVGFDPPIFAQGVAVNVG